MFHCTCSGFINKFRNRTVCPVRWQVNLQDLPGGQCKWSIVQHNSHPEQPEQPAQAEEGKPKRRQARQHFDACLQCVIQDVPIAKPYDALALRQKAREVCSDVKLAEEAGRLPFKCSMRSGWQAIQEDNKLKIALDCTSCLNPKACKWKGAAIFDASDPHNLRCIIRCNGSGTHDPAGQRSMSGTGTAAQKAQMDADKARTALARLANLKSPDSSTLPDPHHEASRKKTRHFVTCEKNAKSRQVLAQRIRENREPQR